MDCRRPSRCAGVRGQRAPRTCPKHRNGPAKPTRASTSDAFGLALIVQLPCMNPAWLGKDGLVSDRVGVAIRGLPGLSRSSSLMRLSTFHLARQDARVRSQTVDWNDGLKIGSADRDAATAKEVCISASTLTAYQASFEIRKAEGLKGCKTRRFSCVCARAPIGDISKPQYVTHALHVCKWDIARENGEH